MTSLQYGNISPGAQKVKVYDKLKLPTVPEVSRLLDRRELHRRLALRRTMRVRARSSRMATGL